MTPTAWMPFPTSQKAMDRLALLSPREFRCFVFMMMACSRHRSGTLTRSQLAPQMKTYCSQKWTTLVNALVYGEVVEVHLGQKIHLPLWSEVNKRGNSHSKTTPWFALTLDFATTGSLGDLSPKALRTLIHIMVVMSRAYATSVEWQELGQRIAEIGGNRKWRTQIAELVDAGWIEIDDDTVTCPIFTDANEDNLRRLHAYSVKPSSPAPADTANTPEPSSVEAGSDRKPASRLDRPPRHALPPVISRHDSADIPQAEPVPL